VQDSLAVLAYSALTSAPRHGDGWSRAEYVFSRFVADCARHAGFDAIRYPSTRLDCEGHNLAVLNDGKPQISAASIVTFHEIRPSTPA
jgi:hypothetical protein